MKQKKMIGLKNQDEQNHIGKLFVLFSPMSSAFRGISKAVNVAIGTKFDQHSSYFYEK